MTRPSAALALLALCACATPAAEVQPEERRERSPCEYYPLAVGNRWVYDSARPDGATQSVTVTTVGEQGGYFRDDRGGNLACTPSGVRDDKRYLLEAPLEKGHTWKAVTGVGTTEVVTIEDVGAPVTVKAGSFRETVTATSRVRIDAQTTLENEMVFARGVGIVRFRTQVIQNGKAIPQIVTELREFKPAPPAAAAAPKS